MAPSAARDAVDHALSGRVGEDQLAEVRLLVSEVVTNAVRHSARRDGTVDLHVALRHGKVRVDVADGGAGFEPPAQAREAGESGGWGLVVVDRLAHRWGVDATSGTRVWFEVAIPPSGMIGGAMTMTATARNL